MGPCIDSYQNVQSGSTLAGPSRGLEGHTPRHSKRVTMCRTTTEICPQKKKKAAPSAESAHPSSVLDFGLGGGEQLAAASSLACLRSTPYLVGHIQSSPIQLRFVR